jgi:hypothetical protein
MDKIIEEKFVKAFIDKRIQDRFLFELLSGNVKKRENAISRFAHGTERHIKKQCIHLCGEKLKIDDIEQEIKKLTQDTKQCYVITGACDGEIMPLKQALEKCFNEFRESIMIVNDSVSFIKAEIERGSPMKYILYKKTLDYKEQQ